MNEIQRLKARTMRNLDRATVGCFLGAHDHELVDSVTLGHAPDIHTARAAVILNLRERAGAEGFLTLN